MNRTTLLLATVAALLAGCSDKGTQPDTTPAVDQRVFDLIGGTGDGQVTCGDKIYPCGPYGTKTGDVAANMEFVGFQDPNEQCATHKDKVIDQANLTKISFKSFHQGGSSCSPRKLLWVIVSAGWCGPCQEDVSAAEKEYAAGNVDSRLAILNIMFETGVPVTAITEAFTLKWINTVAGTKEKPSQKVTFPVVMDPEFKMGAYFSKAAVPFNMLIDLSTMKIYYQQVGGNATTVGPKVQAFFQGT